MNNVHITRRHWQEAFGAVAPRVGIVHRAWFQRALPWLVTRLFLGDVRLVGGERIPAAGPVLFVGWHRAGLMDGWAYSQALPRPTVFLLAARLRTKPSLRLLVAGIEVARGKDGGDPAGNRRRNAAALAACRAELAAGRTVFVFPEGTSSLGPSHLPFEPGAALLARACPAATVVPLAIHYVHPTRIGTDVEVVVGRPFGMAPGTTPLEAQARLTASLEETGVMFADGDAQRAAEDAARAARRRGGSYAAALAGQPEDGLAVRRRSGGWTRLRAGLRLAACTVNLPALLVARLAGRSLADSDNVVLVWAVMAGLPAAGLWALALPAVLWAAGLPGWAAAYLAVTALDLALPRAGHRHD